MNTTSTRLWLTKKKVGTPRIRSSKSDGLDMSQKIICGSIGQRWKISLRWIPIARNIRNYIQAEVGELVARWSRFMQKNRFAKCWEPDTLLQNRGFGPKLCSTPLKGCGNSRFSDYQRLTTYGFDPWGKPSHGYDKDTTYYLRLTGYGLRVTG